MAEVVTCGACRHFEANDRNPAAGVGRCKCDASGRSTGAAMGSRAGLTCWPMAPRRCGAFNPHADYEQDKAGWIAANPSATPEQYEQAMRAIAQRAGV